MSGSQTRILAQVYAAETPEEQGRAYDAWSSSYEDDIFSYNMRLPANAAAVFAGFVTPGTGPILDAGCGTGLQTEPLVLLGHGPFDGIDLSEGMMQIARAKGIYRSLARATLGEALDIADGAYPVTYCIGALTPGHAPPRAIDELVRVTRSGGLLILSLRHDKGIRNYLDAIETQENSGALAPVFSTAEFTSMPKGAPEVRHAVHVWKRQ